MTFLLIFDFPEDLMLPLCTKWISLKDLCRLDSAICIKNKRTEFLRSVEALKVVFNNDHEREPVKNNITNKSLKWLALRQISVENITMKNDVVGSVIEENLAISGKVFHRVRSASFHWNNNFNESTVVAVLDKCAELEKFSFVGFKTATDGALSRVAKNSPGLVNVSVSGCWKLTDDALKTLAQSCTKLESLDLSACFSITDEAMVALANHCKLVRSINIQHCEKITDAGVTALAAQLGGRIRSLNLNSCIQITDEGLTSIALHCSALEKIDISYLKHVTDRSLNFIVSHCRNLKELTIEGCHNLTELSIKTIMDKCVNLDVLVIKYCQKLTTDKLAVLKESPKFKHMHLMG